MSSDTTPVYCLRHRQLVQATYPANVTGALARCPLCGLIDEPVTEAQHVFNPPPALLALLRELEIRQSEELAVDVGFEAECPNCHYVQVIKGG